VPGGLELVIQADLLNLVLLGQIQHAHPHLAIHHVNVRFAEGLRLEIEELGHLGILFPFGHFLGDILVDPLQLHLHVHEIQPVETDLEIVQIDLGGGAVQLSWGDLEVMPVTRPSRNLRQAKVVKDVSELKVSKVKVKGGGEQYAFL